MAFCHECGKEVAETDVFCPYCGVSLEPVSLGGREAGGVADPFDSTIAIDQADREMAAAPQEEVAGAEPGGGGGEIGDESFDDIPTPLFIQSGGVVPDTPAPAEENIETASAGDETAPEEQVADPVKALSEENIESDVEQTEVDAEENLETAAASDEDPAEEQIAAPWEATSEENTEDSVEELPAQEVGENEGDDVEAAPEQIEEPGETAPAEFIEETAEEVPAREVRVDEARQEDFSWAQDSTVPGAEIRGEQPLSQPEDQGSEDAAAGPVECGEEIAEVVLEPETGESTEDAAEMQANEPEAGESTEDQVEMQANEPETDESTEDHAEIQAPAPEPEAPIAKPASSGDLYSEITPFPDEGISRPNEALDAPAAAQPPSIFDSVRIMDSDPASSQAAPAGSAPAAAEAPAEPASAEDGAKSFTTPNIGGVDTDGKRSTKLKPLDEGTILNNRYEIVRKIGGGGMGAVYLASDNNLGGVLRAVKEMVQTHIEEEQQDKAINDFKRESMILSTLDHPSIPTIYDYFFDEKESRFYLVMKYISGGDLSSRIRSAPEGRIDERTITEWAIQIADVLDYLHNRPSTIVYRDLKPSNVMLDGNTGRVMLIDFGIARSINQIQEKGVTAVGTMGYAPPELFSGNVEPRSDIYSLGSTMFHLLTGADPQNNPLLIFDFQKNPRPRQINPQLSDQIERILMHSVEYNSQSRFGSAGEMRQILEDHLENLKTGRVTYGVKEIPASIGLANQPVFCGFCGQKIVATDMFCAFCGAKQPLAQQGVHAEIYARSAMTARLMVIGTNELDTPAFMLEKDENLVGRRDPMSNIFPEIDLSKFDPQTKISRRHAKIWRDGTSYLVEDLGSSNGTILLPVVNDSKRLPPHQPHILANGDKIKMGDTTLHFVIG
jgi:serine/threonine-protein kinase